MDLNRYKNLLKNNKGILIVLFIFIVVYSFNLDKYPYIWSDEAWFSNSAFTLATQGFLGTTMMPYFYDIAHFTYWQPPVYLLLLSLSFKLFGFGIIQARMVSITLGFFTVLFTYIFGKELYNKKTGLIASVLLVSNPLFFFISRDARMDIAVACFTLIALYFLLIALKRSKCIYYFYSGLFSMLSLLSHPNGIFGIFSVLLIYCVYKFDFKNFKLKFRLKEVLYFILGPLLLLIPYLYYISLDFPAFTAQFKVNILNSATTPLINVFSEITRYQVLTNFYIINSSLINFILILTVSAYLTLFGLVYMSKNKKFSKFLAIIILVHLVSVTILVSQKLAFWYLGAILPYWALLIAIPFKEKFNQKKYISTILTIVLALYLISNIFTISNIFLITKEYDYQSIEHEVQKYIPNESVIVGTTAFWIPLHTSHTYYTSFSVHAHYNLSISSFKKLKVNYILYDDSWASVSTPKFKEYLRDNCTLITEIHQNLSLPPDLDVSSIKIYRINNLQ